MKYCAPNLPKAPNNADALEWGWLDPWGEAIKCTKPKHLKFYSHHDSTGKNGLPHWTEIFKQGYVRYAVGHDGSALFNYIPLAEIKRRVVRFIKNHPNITGPVHLDEGGEKNFNEVEVLDRDEALEFLAE